MRRYLPKRVKTLVGIGFTIPKTSDASYRFESLSPYVPPAKGYQPKRGVRQIWGDNLFGVRARDLAATCPIQGLS